MIRIGLCTELEFVPEIKDVGFDYLELPLRQVAALSEEAFVELTELIDSAGLRIEALNHMLPDDLRVTGPDVFARQQHDYLEQAFARAKRLGAEVISFDAATSRNVPNDFDHPMAWRQLNNFLRIVQGHAVGFGIRVAIQPIRRTECNLLNHLSEATMMASLLQMSQIGVLGDTVQMALSSESLESLTHTGNLLWHVHTGNALKRTLPANGDGEDYQTLFQTLQHTNYDGRVSCIAAHEYTVTDAVQALECLREARDNIIKEQA